MQIVEFSLQRYRSIDRTERLRLGDLTILIGPNNEGKSNILQGLVTGMRLLASTHDRPIPGRRPPTLTRYRVPRSDYEWERDFPIRLQATKPQGTTIFDFVFKLSPEEVIAFKSEVNSTLNGRLPIRLTASADSLNFEVRKSGRGAKALTAKRAKVAAFVAKRINPQAIPAIRTAQESMAIVEEMVDQALRDLERSAEYAAAIDTLSQLRQPILESIGNNLRDMLTTFLPDVTAVHVDIRDRYRGSSQCEIIVDDGTATDLRRKGDGVQSLAAISVIHHVSQRALASREIVLALEEPEAHLHPRAVHQVRRVIEEIAARQQVIVTTHSPLLVNRRNIAANVIVHRKSARPARSVAEIREVLGVTVADNLVSSEIVLVVEGREDVKELRALLAQRSPRIADALEQARLAIDDMHGCSNLRYRLGLMASQLCRTHVMLDHDEAGRTAAELAKREGLLEDADRTFATSRGMVDSEIEDWIDLDLYATPVLTHYNVDLRADAFKKRKAKWSKRVGVEFQRAGQLWNDQVEREVKSFVAELVENDPERALYPTWSEAFGGLVRALETKLDT